ncbi:hypothetical protein ACO0R3_002203 [Hanseniaspora guilliermondii]
MAILKKKQSSDQYHSRKSSLNSTASSASSSHSIVPKPLNDEKGNHSPLSPLIGTSQGSSKSQPVTRNCSRMSSAPIITTSNNNSIPNTPIFQTSSNHSHVNSAAKRFSLSLRSFSSNSSLNNNSVSKEDLTKPNEVTSTSSPSNNTLLSDSKLIFDWDVTDPKSWTWQRVVLWLQVNEFSPKWISFFRRSQISGNDFLKLMAYENFAKIEKYLPPSPNSSYNRFQHILKRTMEHNVIYQHKSNSRSVSSLDSIYSRKSNKHLRNGSDQISLNSSSNLITNKSSEKLVDVIENDEEHDTFQKSNSVQSENSQIINEFDISSSSTIQMDASDTPKNFEGPVKVPKLNIPVPPSNAKLRKKSDNQKHESFSALYRRSFISIMGNNTSTKTDVTTLNESTTSSSKQNKQPSIDSRKNSPVTSPSSSGYSFFKKIQKHTTSDVNPLTNPIDPRKVVIEDIYVPKKRSVSPDEDEDNKPDVYIYCTKDRLSFTPLNVKNVNDPTTLKAAIATHNNINHKNYSIYLVDFEFEIGEQQLTDEVMKIIIDAKFPEEFNKFYVKNHLKIQLNRNRSSSSLLSQQSRKMSLKSSISKSSIGSTSDLDDVENGLKYPKTPGHILETAQDYIDASNTMRPNRSRKSTISKNNLSQVNERQPDTQQSSSNHSSFKVIRPDTSNKIDFNKKRETPFVKLNPTREAPPPPLSPGISINSGTDNDMKKRRRPPPPNMLSSEDNNPEMNDIKTKISNQSISFLNATPGVYTKNDSDHMVQQPPKPGFSRKSSLVSLSKRSSQHTLNKPDSQQSLNHTTNTTRLSRSNSSIQSSIYTSPPKLLKRDSSRRIVSSALAGGDTFDENNIVFKNVPEFSDSSDDGFIKKGYEESSDDDGIARKIDHVLNNQDQVSSKFNQQALDTTKKQNSKTVDEDVDSLIKEFEMSLKSDKNTVSNGDVKYSEISTEDSDDSGIAWVHTDIKKKSLLQDEISSEDDHKFQDYQLKANISNNSESDDGIFWSNNNASNASDKLALIKAKPKLNVETKKDFEDSFHSLDFNNVIHEEDEDNSTNNKGDKRLSVLSKDEKVGFSFDSESMLGSFIHESPLPEEDPKNMNSSAVTRKMTLRPSADIVYENLEVFFPGRDLDKPIFEGDTCTASPKSSTSSRFNRSGDRHKSIIEASTIQHSSEKDDYTFSSSSGSMNKNSSQNTPNNSVNSQSSNKPMRKKTLRILANEALAVRKKYESETNKLPNTNLSEINQSYDNNSSQMPLLKRQNTTKLWGKKVIEITEKEKVVEINKNKNSQGQYKEFAWIRGEVIGKGSFGCVYLGMNLTTGEMIAVKQVESSTESQIEALRSEMDTLKNLDHLNIVQYLGFEAKNNVYSLFLEYVAGGSVGSLIRMFGRFDDELIRFLNHQVLQGLSYLHNQGILHRDMKADNLLLDLDGVCKISDFGISKRSTDIYSNSEMTMTGTIFWMAPEMVDTKQGYSAKVDVWSLGCIVLEMFAGKRPWSNLEVVAAMFKIGKYKSAPPIPKDTLPLISPEGLTFLNLCFCIDPEKRPTADYLLRNKIFPVNPNFTFMDHALAKFTNANHKTMSLPSEKN